MVRWNTTFKAILGAGALTSLLVSSGAGLRWGQLLALIRYLF